MIRFAFWTKQNKILHSAHGQNCCHWIRIVQMLLLLLLLLSHFSPVQLYVAPWTAAHQAPPIPGILMHWDLIQCVALLLSKQLKTGAQILPFTSLGSAILIYPKYQFCFHCVSGTEFLKLLDFLSDQSKKAKNKTKKERFVVLCEWRNFWITPKEVGWLPGD